MSRAEPTVATRIRICVCGLGYVSVDLDAMSGVNRRALLERIPDIAHA